MVLKKRSLVHLCYWVFVQDLPSAVERISLFLGKELTDEQLANVVKHSTFNNMQKIPQANYEQIPDSMLNHHQGRFMRKGKSVYCFRCIQELNLSLRIIIPKSYSTVNPKNYGAILNKYILAETSIITTVYTLTMLLLNSNTVKTIN